MKPVHTDMAPQPVGVNGRTDERSARPSQRYCRNRIAGAAFGLPGIAFIFISAKIEALFFAIFFVYP